MSVMCSSCVIESPTHPILKDSLKRNVISPREFKLILEINNFAEVLPKSSKKEAPAAPKTDKDDKDKDSKSGKDPKEKADDKGDVT